MIKQAALAVPLVAGLSAVLVYLAPVTPVAAATTVHGCISAAGVPRFIRAGTSCRVKETPFQFQSDGVGPQGPKGDTGNQGIQGIQGIQGVQGVQGVPGEGIIGGATSPLFATTPDQFIGPFNSTRSHTESDVTFIMPTAGTLEGFYVLLDGSPGSGNSYQFIVRLNGANTALGCTVANAADRCSDVTNVLSFAESDVISILVRAVSAPTSRSARWGALVLPQ